MHTLQGGIAIYMQDLSFFTHYDVAKLQIDNPITIKMLLISHFPSGVA